MRAIFRSSDNKVKILIETKWKKWIDKKSKYKKFSSIKNFWKFCKSFEKRNNLTLKYFSHQSRIYFDVPENKSLKELLEKYK